MRQLNFLLLVVLLALVACKKTTVCSGVVYDGGTGLPLEGAGVFLSTYYDHSKDLTDPSGRYSVSLEVDKDEEVYLSTGKDFYIGKGQSVENGSTNEIDFTINPIDSDLEITFVNDSTPSGKIFVCFSGPFYNNECSISNGSALQTIPYQTTFTKRFRVAGGQDIWIYWDYNGLNGDYRSSDHIDTVYCPNRETTSWTIRF